MLRRKKATPTTYIVFPHFPRKRKISPLPFKCKFLIIKRYHSPLSVHNINEKGGNRKKENNNTRLPGWERGGEGPFCAAFLQRFMTKWTICKIERMGEGGWLYDLYTQFVERGRRPSCLLSVATAFLALRKEQKHFFHHGLVCWHRLLHRRNRRRRRRRRWR